MPRKTRIGVVGAGTMPQRAHIPNLLAESQRCAVVALADARVNTAQLVAERYRIPNTYPDVYALLADSDVDAVVISVPDQAHRDVAVAALDAGKHVFLEKPIATNTEDACAIVEAVRNVGTVFQIGFQRRFDPAAQTAKRLIDQWRDTGEMGALKLVRYHSVGGDWIRNADPIVNAGDAPVVKLPAYVAPHGLTDDLRRAWPWFNNYTQHVLDLLRHYLGAPTAVITSHPVHDPVSVVTLDWAGARVVLMDGPSQPGKWEEWIEFHYDKGWLQFRTPPALAVRVTGQVEVYRAAEGRCETYDSPPEWAFRNEIRHFLRAVAGEIPPSPNAEDALAIQYLTEEIFRTAMDMSEPRRLGNQPMS